MRTARTRSQDLPGKAGRYATYYGNTKIGADIVWTPNVKATTCYDSVGSTDTDGELTIKRLVGDPARLHGHYRWYNSTGYRALIYEGLPIFNKTATGLVEFQWNIADPDWNNLTAAAMRVLNPNKALVDLPVSLLELRDVPRMVRFFRDYGQGKLDNLLQFHGGLYLTGQFGVLPILNDLLGLSQMADQIARRATLLRKMSVKPRRVKRKLGQWGYQSLTTPSVTVWQWGASAKAHTEVKGSYDCWVTARVGITTDLSGLTDSHHEALLSALGLSPSLSTVWELIPWSWLIDWFTNFGDILSLTRNRIPYQLSRMNIMAKFDQPVRTVLDSGPSTMYLTQGTARFIVKRRRPTVPLAFSAFSEFLASRDQIQILLALITSFATSARRFGYR